MYVELFWSRLISVDTKSLLRTDISVFLGVSGHIRYSQTRVLSHDVTRARVITSGPSVVLSLCLVPPPLFILASPRPSLPALAWAFCRRYFYQTRTNQLRARR